MRSAFLLFRLSLLSAIVLAGLPARAEEFSCAQNFAKISAGWKLYRGKATAKLDPASYSIFEKVRLNPAAELNAEELAHIKEAGLEATLEQYRGTNAAVRKMNEFIANGIRAKPVKKDLSLDARRGMKEKISDLYYFGGYSFMGGMPLHGGSLKKFSRGFLDYAGFAFLPNSPVGGPTQAAGAIYANALKTNNFVLSDRQAKFLKFWKLDEDFQRFAAEAQEHREGFLTATRVRQGASVAQWSVIGSAAAAQALAPLVASERIEDASALEKKIVGIKGGVQLLFSDNEKVPAMLRTKSEAVLFEMGKAKYLKGEKLAEFDRELLKQKVNYSRVALNATAAEVKKVMDAAKEFVTRTKLDENGKKVLDSRMYIDAPIAETYRILQAELGMPPAPVIKRHQGFMEAYLGIAKLAGGKDGRVKEVFRSRLAEDSPGEAREAVNNAFDAYFNAMIYTVSPKLVVPAVLAVDSMANTRIQQVQQIREKAKADEPAAARPSVPVSQ